MNKEEFLKIQNCVLKVHIHCDGCKDKVKKILQKIEGVYKIKIEAEEGRVIVCGNVDPAILIKKLSKYGKHAELWASSNNNNSKGNTNNQFNNQFKNLQIQSGKNGCGANNKAVQDGGQKGQQQQQQPKGGQGQHPQMKGISNLKLPQQFVKGPKMGPGLGGGGGGPGKNPKAVKFSLREDDGLSDDDEFDEFDDEDDDFDDQDDFDDEIDVPVGKMMKPQMPNVMMQNNMMNGLGKGVPGGSGGANGGGNGKKSGGGGGGSVPNHGGGGGGGKKVGNGKNNGGNQNHEGGKGGGGGVAQNKNGGNNGNGFNANGAKKGSDGPPQGKMMMPNMMGMNGGGAGLGPRPMAGQGAMGNPPMGPGQMSNVAAVQGLPASSMSMNGGGFQGGNPYYPQQLAAMMVNQQHANGNERFQPMMYARPPAAVNYKPPYYPPYPYPYPPPGDRVDQYSMFSDENTNACTIM